MGHWLCFFFGVSCLRMIEINQPIDLFRKPDPEIIAQCQKYGEPSCTWLTGNLVPPGSKPPDAYYDLCEHIDSATGKLDAIFAPTETFHIFWNENIAHSGWFETCPKYATH
jgi:hypothetical protein